MPTLLVGDEQALAAAPRTEDDADVVVVLFVDLQAGIGHGHLRRRDREVHGRLGPPGVLEVPVRVDVEVVDLAACLVLVGRGVEMGDLADPGTAVDQICPDGFKIVAERAHDPHSGDDDSSVVIGLAHGGQVLLGLGCAALAATGRG